MESSFETLGYEEHDGVAHVTFARPRVLNAYNTAMSGELVSVVRRLRAARDVRVVVLRGQGSHFMAGADIGMLQSWSNMSEGRVVQDLLRGFSPTFLEHLPQPVVAAVDGFALGMGCEVAIASDARIVTDRAQFGLPEITLGLIPGAGGTQRLPRLIGRTRAAEMIMTGRRIGAAEAMEWGLVNRVVPPDQLDRASEEFVGDLLSKSPLALRRAKEAIVLGSEGSLAEGLQGELGRFLRSVGSDDAHEGTLAFLEKRKPTFAGR